MTGRRRAWITLWAGYLTGVLTEMLLVAVLLTGAGIISWLVMR